MLTRNSIAVGGPLQSGRCPVMRGDNRSSGSHASSAERLADTDDRVGTRDPPRIGHERRHEWRQYLWGKGSANASRLVLIVWQRHLDSLDVAYAAADLVTVTSSVEGVPLTLMESLMAGLPALATKVGGIPDLEGTEGVTLTSPEDFEEMAHKLKMLIREGPRRVRPDGRFSVEEMLRSYDLAVNTDVSASI